MEWGEGKMKKAGKTSDPRLQTVTTSNHRAQSGAEGRVSPDLGLVPQGSSPAQVRKAEAWKAWTRETPGGGACDRSSPRLRASARALELV